MSVNEKVGNVAKVAKYFTCEKCDYNTSKQYNYDKHVLTAKHQKKVVGDQNDALGDIKSSNKYMCNKCSKQYDSHNGIWLHKKKCIVENCHEQTTTTNTNIESNQDIFKKDNMIEYLINENKEFKNLIMELIKKDSINNTICNSNSNNNNTFNLQVFLNDKCKDAMNMSEFVDTIKIQLSDLENFAHVDYADGISKILLKNFNNLETCLRPIHCSDLKRETLYIKENNCWTKETDDKLILKKAIKQVAFKNIRQINEWVKENPGCQDPRTKQNVKYNKIVMNSMSGGTIEEQKDNIEKIVKNVTKAVAIEKNSLKY
jgi:hypothetical protein